MSANLPVLYPSPHGGLKWFSQCDKHKVLGQVEQTFGGVLRLGTASETTAVGPDNDSYFGL